MKKFTRLALTCTAVFALGAAIIMTSCGKDKEVVLEEPTPVPLNARITWKDGKYALTTDPTDAGLFFKFGSVVGIYSGNGAVLTLPANENTGDVFDTGDIAWNPTDATVWESIPTYEDMYYPANVDAAYHTAANVKVGKGDPCRLVGLDLAKIESTAAGSLSNADIDNGKWRLPTNEENQSFSGQTKYVEYTAHWLTENGVNGGMFPNAITGSAATLLPATGYRYYMTGAFDGVSADGSYWSSTLYSANFGYYLYFDANGLNPSNNNARDTGLAVRCVSQ